MMLPAVKAPQSLKQYRDAGFSLPEILVVVVIVGIIAAIAIPRLTDQEDRAALASARADARQIAVTIETGLPELSLAGEADIEYNANTTQLSVFEGSQLQVTVKAKLSPGSFLPAAAGGDGNNRIRPDGSYCVAVQNRDQIAYYSRSGFVASCVDGADTVGVGGGSGGVGGGGGTGGGGGGTTPVTNPKNFLPPGQTDPAVSWRSIVFGGGIFVATGTSTTYGTSTSGLPDEWNLSKSLPAVPTSLAYGGDRFIVATNDAFYTTTDPLAGNWTAVSASLPATGDWRIAYGNGRFVAVTPSGGGKYGTSTDGTTWTFGDTPVQLTKIAFAGSKFLAILDGSVGSTTAYTTTDGSSWTSAPLPDPSGGFWVNISTAGNAFFLTGNNSTTANMATSTDGTTWNKPSLPTVSVWQFAVGGAGVIYLIPSNTVNAVISLNGGTNWSVHGLPEAAPWTAGTTGSTGIITVVGDSGWVMSST